MSERSFKSHTILDKFHNLNCEWLCNFEIFMINSILKAFNITFNLIKAMTFVLFNMNFFI